MVLMRASYVRAACAIAILVLVNVFPASLGSPKPVKIALGLYPQNPHNAFYLCTDTTITVCINNTGTAKDVELRLINLPQNTTVNGRDGLALPLRVQIRENENFYYSIALIALDNAQSGNIELFVVDADNEEVLCKQSLLIRKIVPRLILDQLISMAKVYGLSGNVAAFAIPKYRRYWHPELNEFDDAVLGYVWLLVSPQGNVLIDDNSGKMIAENLVVPWHIEAIDYGTARIWSGDGFKDMRVPTVQVVGDLSFNFNRFELYYASWYGRPVWVTRQSFYWTHGEEIDEIPDTERIELWLSAENGEKLSTVSDYHYHAFRYDPVDSYTILAYFHCPLASDLPQSWFNFLVAEYENVYPMSNAPYDHMGFFLDVHPIGRAMQEYKILIERNFVGLVLVGVLYLAPKIKWIYKRKRSGGKRHHR